MIACQFQGFCVQSIYASLCIKSESKNCYKYQEQIESPQRNKDSIIMKFPFTMKCFKSFRYSVHYILLKFPRLNLINYPVDYVIMFFLLSTLFLEVSLCMPASNGAVNPNIIDVYRPIIAQLPTESSWTYLFSNFDELDNVVRTSRGGQLLNAQDAYELIQQLYPVQLNSLLDSVLMTFGPNAPEITEQLNVISRQLSLESNRLLMTLGEIAQGISLIRGTDVSNQPLDESFSALLTGFHLSPEAERFFATQVLLRAEPLHLQYSRLFPFLRFVGRH